MSKEIKKGSKGVIVTEDNDACRLLQFCPDIDGWPRSWAGEEIDITPGRKVVEFLKPFLLYLLTTKLAPKTLRRHRDHMWMLGGEVIRSLEDDPSLRRKPIEKVTFDLLEEEGGPLIWPQITEQQQDAFDASCRKLYPKGELQRKRNNQITRGLSPHLKHSTAVFRMICWRRSEQP